MKRLRLAATIAFGIATAAVVVLWWRSYSSADRLEGWSPGGQSLIVASKQGGVAVMIFPWEGPATDWKWQLKSCAVDDFNSFPADDMAAHTGRSGFGELDYATYEVSPTFQRGDGVVMQGETYWLRGEGVIVPYWSLVLTGAALTLATRWRGRFSVRGLLLFLAIAAVSLVGLKLLLTGEPEVDEVPLP